MYRLAIKESAIETNPAVEELVGESGLTLELDSKQDAEDLASRLSTEGKRVRIQGVAPQDSDDIDGYLIRWPERYVSEPKDSDIEGLTFDVGANLYGEIGKTLICGKSGLSPGIKYYFYEERDDVDERKHTLRGIHEPCLPDDVPSEVTWSPDCLVQVRLTRLRGIEAQFFCEIKTGDASFERSQAGDMRTVAEYYNVLKIRVIIDELPNEYTFRIHEVDPE